MTNTSTSLLTDGLRAEREQGITIDVAYRYFHTPRRKFIIADTPGHVQYTRNMVTGTSTADLSVILVDARKGVVEQSKRHTFISSLLGVAHLVVCVNKMDLVAWDEVVFERICDDFRSFAAKLGGAGRGVHPDQRGCTATTSSTTPRRCRGTRVCRCSTTSSTCTSRRIATSSTCASPSSASCGRCRSATTTIAATRARRPAGYCAPATTSSCCRPDGRAASQGIDTYDGPLDAAFTPPSVTVRLEDDLDVSRGDMICRPHNQPALLGERDPTICWMTETALAPGATYLLKQTTRSVKAVVERLHRRTGCSSG